MAKQSSVFASVNRGVRASSGSALLVALTGLAAPACFPYVVPPARVSIGSAARNDGALTSTGERPSYAQIRAGLHPLDVAENELPVDVGVGYETEFADSGRVPTVQGGYAEFGAYPLQLPLGTSLSLRAGPYAAVEALARSGVSGVGLGGTLGALVELTGRVNGPVSSSGPEGTMSAGFGRGRWAIGIFGSGAVRSFSDGTYESAAVGVSIRMPLLAGVVFPSASHDSDDHDHYDDHDDHHHGSAPARTPATATPARTPATPRPKR